MFITVPFLVIEAPTLTVDSPAEGAQFENGAIPVRGTTSNAEGVAITAVQTGNADGTPIATAAPPSPAPSGRRHRRAPRRRSCPPDPRSGRSTVEVGDDGTFDTPLDLSEGKWKIVVTATSARARRRR